MASRLRKEIEALRNQEKATTGYVTDIGNISIYSYIKRDLIKTLLFVIVILIVLFLLCLKFSNLNVFNDIRNTFHISRYIY